MSKISVKALIIRKDRVLLLRPKNLQGSFNGWDGPGGHVEVGETILDALKREVLEETKIKIDQAYPIKLLHVPQVDTDYLIFLCTASKGRVILSHEHTDYKWMDLISFRNMVGSYLSVDLAEMQSIIEKLLGK